MYSVLSSNTTFKEPNGINSRLKSVDVVQQAILANAGNISKATANMPNMNTLGVSVNNTVSTSGTSTNDYLINQKLRNSGIYTKLKNKTIYSASSLPHASLNSNLL